MHSQSEIISDSYDSVAEYQASVFGLDLDIDDLTVADAVVCCISRSHMDVSLGSDNAFFQFDFTAGANQLDAGSAFDITGFSDLGFNTKGSGIGQ